MDGWQRAFVLHTLQQGQRAAADGPAALRQNNQDRLTQGSALSRLNNQQ